MARRPSPAADGPTPDSAASPRGLDQALLERCRGLSPAPTGVVHPCDEASIEGLVEAAALGLIAPVLIGPEPRIRAAAERASANISGFRLLDTPHSHASAALGIVLAAGGEVAMLMKGSLHTDELMHEVVAGGTGLRTARRVSHVFVMDVASYPRWLFITDAAINVAPNLEDKRDIIQNAIDLAQALGIPRPRVAILSAVETVTSKLPSTIEAAALCKMADRGQITGALLDGPLALDNAVSPEAAKEKGIVSDVAGRADILVVPDLEAGNMLVKSLSFIDNAESAGIVIGARVPIMLTSRADSRAARVASCAIGRLLVEAAATPKAP